MEVVSFFDIEETEHDLMISFAIDIGDGYIETLLLHRQLIGEFALPEDERGTKVSHTGHEVSDEFLNCLESVEVNGAIMSIKARFSSYQIDLRKISKEDINQICESLKRHNFDNQFKVQ